MNPHTLRRLLIAGATTVLLAGCGGAASQSPTGATVSPPGAAATVVLETRLMDRGATLKQAEVIVACLVRAGEARGFTDVPDRLLYDMNAMVQPGINMAVVNDYGAENFSTCGAPMGYMEP